MIAARELTADQQPDGAVDFVAACSSAIHDDGGSLEWRWLGESHVRLSSQLPGRPIVTLDVRGQRRKPGRGKGRQARR